jgi:hypothetical protein
LNAHAREQTTQKQRQSREKTERKQRKNKDVELARAMSALFGKVVIE